MAILLGSICVKFSEKTGRTRLDDINLCGLVSTLKERVSAAIGVPSSELLMVYCGRPLRDKETLKSYGLETGCTIHALRKKMKPPPKAEPLDDLAIRQLMTALHAALLNPSHRQAVHKILTSTETIDSIIAATPGLAEDHIAVSMLRDPELLIQIADAENVRRIVRAHPAIGHAVMHVAASVSEDGVQSDRARGSETGQGSVQPDLSDDEMDTSVDGRDSSRPQLITQAQLSAALAAAGVGNSAGSSAGAYTEMTFQPYGTAPSRRSAPTGAPTQTASQPQLGPSSRPRTTGQSSVGLISADLFSQAMAQALQRQQQQQQQSPAANRSTSGEPSDPADGAALRPEQLQVQLQQLHSMGITDDAVCMQALQATGGNVQAALDLIFEGRLS